MNGKGSGHMPFTCSVLACSLGSRPPRPRDQCLGKPLPRQTSLPGATQVSIFHFIISQDRLFLKDFK